MWSFCPYLLLSALNEIGITKFLLRLEITGWAVALTCYVSYSAKHRKMADFDPSGSRNPLTNFDETWHPGPHLT